MIPQHRPGQASLLESGSRIPHCQISKGEKHRKCERGVALCPKMWDVMVIGNQNATEKTAAVTDSPPGGGRVTQDCLVQSHAHHYCSDVLAIGD